MVTKQVRLGYDSKARMLVDQMTLDEKISLMSGHTSLLQFVTYLIRGKGYNHIPHPAGGCERLGIPTLRFCDGPRGVVSGYSTCFPVTMARGASFDVDLEYKVGDIMGKEVRAAGGNYFGGVCVNLPYHPGWGRSQEVYGEDTMHMGKMASALVKGVQSHNVIACVKHFAFNSMENARFKVNVTADKRTEREVYLPHFKKAIEAGAASVMSAYNKYAGEYCGHSHYLLNEVLKEEWDFDGFVISDFFQGLHETVGGINGGCDVEMCNCKQYAPAKVRRAIWEGKIAVTTIDAAAIRIVRTLMAFKDAKDPQEYPAALAGCEQHLAFAQEVAEKSAVLIKNDSRILPFNKERVRNIVLVGDLAGTANTGDHGSSYLKRTKADHVVSAMEKRLGEEHVQFVQTRDAAGARELLEKAEAVVFVVGMRYTDEGEYLSPLIKVGGDRRTLRLHADEEKMLEELGAINKNTAVVLIGGNVIMLDPGIEKVPSVLMTFYPGVRGGAATVNLLFGDANPSGKLPFAVAKDESDYPAVNWDAEQQHYAYYHGYAKLDKEAITARVPFGFGLSYTDFALRNAGLKALAPDRATFSVQIENTGNRHGGEVAQLYVSCQGSAVDRPVKQLMDFSKVYLDAGESAEVELTVLKKDLGYYDEAKKGLVEEDILYRAYIGRSSDISHATAIPFRFE
jgi:beta-glucosidase